MSSKLYDSPPPQSPAEAMHYRPEIDGLRAVAVLAVVAFHAFPERFPGGFVGVDVFFVISGFLISSIILRQLERGTFTVRGFYARRARRILPALSLLILTCLAFGYVALLPDEFANLGKHVAAASSFVANFSLWRESGYFAPATEFQPMLHLWSLGIEEQFYLIWPLVLILAARRRFKVAGIIAVASIASFGLNLWLVGVDETANFYFPLTRFWELGIGCLLAARDQQHGGPARRVVSGIAPWLSVIGIALIAAAAHFLDGTIAYPGAAALLPTVGAACVIAAPQDNWFSRKILASRILVFIGMISYPLYLWHWPVLSFAAILHSSTPDDLTRFLAVALSFVLAFLTYRFIELPIRSRQAARIGLRLVGATAVLGIAGVIVYAQAGFPERFNASIEAIRVPSRLDDLCLSTVPERNRFNYCLRNSAETPAVVFLGDSQAQGMYEGAASALGSQYPMLLLGHGGCPPLLDVRAAGLGMYGVGSNRETCNAAWRAFADYIRDTRPRMVVLVGAGARFFPKPYPEESAAASARRELNRQAFNSGLRNLVAELGQYSHVIYMLEIPTFSTEPTCFIRPVHLPGDHCTPEISRPRLARQRSEYVASVLDVQRKYPGLLVLDPIPALCTEHSCSQRTASGDLLYRDKLHLTFEGGQRAAADSGLARAITDEVGRKDQRSRSNTNATATPVAPQAPARTAAAAQSFTCRMASCSPG